MLKFKNTKHQCDQRLTTCISTYSSIYKKIKTEYDLKNTCGVIWSLPEGGCSCESSTKSCSPIFCTGLQYKDFTKYPGTLFHTTVTFSGPVSKTTCPTTGGPKQTKYRSPATHPPNPVTSMCPGTVKTMLIERTYSLEAPCEIFDKGTMASIIYLVVCHFSRPLSSNVNTECLK